MAPEKEKITKMILNVDLKCPCCYKKVRKLLCKFPQIRDQVFDVDKNKVIITVVCCDPERLRDKLCCKGGGTIQSIEIVENKPPPPTEDPKDRLSKQLEKKTSGKSEPPQQKPHTQKPFCLPVSVCCQVWYEGRDGCPCHYGYRRPAPPPCYDYYGYQYPSNMPCFVRRCDYFIEDNPQGCSIM